MAKVSVGRAWEDTKAFLSGERRLVVPVALALVTLPLATFRLVAPAVNDLKALLAGDVPAWALVMLYAVLFVELVGLATLIRLAIGKAESLGTTLAVAIPRTVMMLIALALLILAFGLFLTIALIPFAGGAAATAPGAIPPGLARVSLLVTVAMFLFLFRLILLIPAAAVERGGPLALIKRGWQLGKGNGLRLVATMGLVLVASIIANMALVMIVGLIAKLALGSVSGPTLGGLLIALASGLLSALVVAIQAGLLASFYRQATAS